MENALQVIVGAIGLVLVLVMIAGYWRVFAKAGQPGFLVLIPIVNLIVLFIISEQPWWVIILLFIPVLNIVALVLIYNGVAQRFGQGLGFALGIIFLPFIFIPLLGFGDYQVVNSKAKNVA